MRNSNVKYYDYLCARIGLNLRGRYCGHGARCLLHKTGGAVVAQLSYSVVECAVLCVYVYIPDYILFIISDHEENGKSMRNSDYMRVYFPSSVGTRTYTHPSYSFSLL